jgi:N-acetylmuramoyl-L-alanine amidase
VAAAIALALVAVACRDNPSPRARPRSTSQSTPPPTATDDHSRDASAGPQLTHVGSRTVVLDPGHDGGNASHPDEINRLVDAVTLKKPCDTTGTATDDGYTEAAFALDLARRTAAILEQAGATVILTRADDRGWGPCIDERAAIGNRASAAAAVSIHADGGPSSGRGFHVIEPALVAGHTEEILRPSARLGGSIRDAYHASTLLPYATYVGTNGIDVRDDLGGLNLSRVPKVFIECGNMRNSVDARLLENDSFRQRAALALAVGIDRFLAE